jgi:hypothetical protein
VGGEAGVTGVFDTAEVVGDVQAFLCGHRRSLRVNRWPRQGSGPAMRGRTAQRREAAKGGPTPIR